MNQGASGKALTEVASGLEQAQALDGFGDAVSGAVQKLTTGDTIKNLLSGSWLGHALHPMLTDLPIGFWTSAVVLDIVGGQDAEEGADLLLGLGNLSAVATAASGLADWSDANDGPEKRVGIWHGLANASGLAIMSAAWLARKSGARKTGVLLTLVGSGVATGAAYLGGHLVYARGVGVTHAGFEVDQQLPDWTDVAADADVAEGKPLKAMAGEVGVMLARDGGEVRALVSHCSHAGGPLDEGKVEGGAVTCPWHGSRFELAGGCVLRGPASLPQTAFQVRVREGRVEVRA